MSFKGFVTIQYREAGQESTYGTENGAWVPLAYAPGSPAVAAKFPAEIMDMLPSRSESVRQGLEVARNQTRLRMRWRDDITPDMRVIVHRDTDITYHIVAGPAEVKGRKRFMEFVIEKFTSAGNDG